MRKILAALVAVSVITTGAGLSFACNSKSECIAEGKKAYAAKNYEKAKEYFKKAIQFDPKDEKAWRYYDRALKQIIVKELGEEEGC